MYKVMFWESQTGAVVEVEMITGGSVGVKPVADVAGLTVEVKVSSGVLILSVNQKCWSESK